MSHQQHKREREDAPHHQNKKREHAPSNKTHTKSFIFNTKSELLSQQPDGGLEPTAAEQKKQCRSSPRGKRMIISFHYQHKEREGDRVQPPTHKERERERVRPPSNDTHTKPCIATTK